MSIWQLSNVCSIEYSGTQWQQNIKASEITKKKKNWVINLENYPKTASLSWFKKKKNGLTARKILKSQVERWEGKYSVVQKRIVSGLTF